MKEAKTIVFNADNPASKFFAGFNPQSKQLFVLYFAQSMVPQIANAQQANALAESVSFCIVLPDFKPTVVWG
jgi:hypothetical protein